MTGEQIAGCVGIMAMLLIVVNRLANDRTPGPKMLRMAGIWVAIVVVIGVIVVVMRPQG